MGWAQIEFLVAMKVDKGKPGSHLLFEPLNLNISATVREQGLWGINANT